MNWYKMANGELINLGLVTTLRVSDKFQDDPCYYRVKAKFVGSKDEYALFPDAFETNAEALAFINSIYGDMMI